MHFTKPSSLAPLFTLTLITSVLVLASCGDGEAPRTPAGKPPGTPPPSSEAPAGNTELHPNLAAAREALRDNRLPEARDLLAAVPEEDPSYLLALHDLGTVYSALGETRAALETLSLLATIETDNPALFIVLSWVQYRENDPAGAELSTLRALELDPDSLAARYNVALFRLAQGRTNEATQAYYRAMRRDFAMEYVGQAREHLLMMQKTRPDYPDVHFMLAFFANAIGNHGEEVDELEKFLAAEPQGAVAETARTQLEEARKKKAP